MSLDDTVNERKGAPIVSRRYSILGFLGRGCWGEVYAARDLFEEKDVAIKVLSPNDLALGQMEHRHLTPYKAMQKECFGLEACAHVVPRRFELDERGMPFIVMPQYKRFLSDLLEPEGFRSNPWSDTVLTRKLEVLGDIAAGLAEMHRTLGRVHGDLKPDNIAINDNGRLLLNDLGTSTCASFGWSNSPRDNMGFPFTRAPECFKEGSHPTARSDVYSFGALAFRIVGGRYLFEPEMLECENPADYLGGLDEKAAAALTEKRIRARIPRGLRPFVRKSLAWHPFDRFSDGSELKGYLDHYVENRNGWRAFRKAAARSALLGSAAVAAGFFIYKAATHEPAKLGIPQIPEPTVITTLDPPGGAIFFERERLALPKAHDADTKLDWSIGLATDNRYAAYLTKTYLNASWHLGQWRWAVVNKPMEAVWTADRALHGHQFMPRGEVVVEIVARNVEYALSRRPETPSGNIDLEDVLVIARCGADAWVRAQRAADSRRFSDYVGATDRRGAFIIEAKDQEFLRLWLAYTRLHSYDEAPAGQTPQLPPAP